MSGFDSIKLSSINLHSYKMEEKEFNELLNNSNFSINNPNINSSYNLMAKNEIKIIK